MTTPNTNTNTNANAKPETTAETKTNADKPMPRVAVPLNDRQEHPGAFVDVSRRTIPRIVRGKAHDVVDENGDIRSYRNGEVVYVTPEQALAFADKLIPLTVVDALRDTTARKAQLEAQIQEAQMELAEIAEMEKAEAEKLLDEEGVVSDAQRKADEAIANGPKSESAAKADAELGIVAPNVAANKTSTTANANSGEKSEAKTGT